MSVQLYEQTYSKDMEDIVALLAQRRLDRSPIIEKARLISQHYNGEIAIPLPELDENEAPAVANLIGQGIDQHSMRIASNPADIYCPPAKPGVKSSEEKARVRRLVANGWLENNTYDLVLRKRARHLVAYSSSPILLRPNEKTKSVMWEAKSPLDTYPAPVLNDLDPCPEDVIFLYGRRFAWLRNKYPDVAARIASSSHLPVRDDVMVELIHYFDAEQETLIATGSIDRQNILREADYGIDGRRIKWNGMDGTPWQFRVELSSVPNLTGRCPVVVPNRISLDFPKGMFDDTVGIWQMQAKMMALEVIAVTRAIFPDTYFVKDAQGQGQIVRAADGLRGIMGEVEGGKLQEINMQPGFQTGNVIDRMERAQRQNSAMPAEYGAESPTNVRTDVRGRSVFSAGVDFYIDEAQKILNRSLKAELEIAADIDTRFYDTRKSYYVSWGGYPGPLDYTPSDIFGESRVMLVDNNYSGLDANALEVALAQGVQTEMISKHTSRKYSPFVKDIKREEALILTENLELALRSGIDAQTQQGAIPAVDIARMIQLARDGNKEFADIVVQVHDEAQQRQATSGPPGTPEGPVPPGSPQAQPGLGAPGAPAATIPAPSASFDNLRSLLSGISAQTRPAGGRFNAPPQ